MPKPLPTPERLRQLLDYDPETGELRWKPRSGPNSWNSRYAGTIAFTALTPDGYRQGCADRLCLLAHRVCWAIATGAWPNGEIDHLNRNPTDNRLANLRIATRSEQTRNVRPRPIRIYDVQIPISTKPAKLNARPRKNLLPEPSLLREVLEYNPETGELRWKRRPIAMFTDKDSFNRQANSPQEMNAAGWNTKWAGKPAFTAVGHTFGYRKGSINNQRLWAHRVIWALVTGAWPEPGMEIDHINGKGGDNRWANLRLGTRTQQTHNASVGQKRQKSWLPRGVYRNNQIAGRRYIAQITVNGTTIYLGAFNTPEEASAAYHAAADPLYGEFAYHKSRYRR